jgi:hypothetical protein
MGAYDNISTQSLTNEFAQDFNIKSRKEKKLLIDEMCNRVANKSVAKNRISDWYCIMMLADEQLPLEDASKFIEYQLREAHLNEELFPRLLNTLIEAHSLKAYSIRAMKLWNLLIKDSHMEACTNYARASVFIAKPIINDPVYKDLINLVKNTFSMVESTKTKVSKTRCDRIIQGIIELCKIDSDKNSSLYEFIKENNSIKSNPDILKYI